MTDKEAMAMALEALECANSPNGDYENEIAALKERLAQPEQEPVAWISPSGALYRTRYHAVANAEQSLTPLYTTPPQRTWVGLTDEEFHEACWESYVDPATGECLTGDREYAVRWTEAKLKEKNA